MLRLIRRVKMGQSFEKSRVCLGFLLAGVLHNRHRTLRDPGSSFRVGRQLEFVNTALERRGLHRYYKQRTQCFLDSCKKRARTSYRRTATRGLEVKLSPQGCGGTSSCNWESGEGGGARAL